MESRQFTFNKVSIQASLIPVAIAPTNKVLSLSSGLGGSTVVDAVGVGCGEPPKEGGGGILWP